MLGATWRTRLAIDRMPTGAGKCIVDAKPGSEERERIARSPGESETPSTPSLQVCVLHAIVENAVDVAVVRRVEIAARNIRLLFRGKDRIEIPRQANPRSDPFA